MSLYKGNKKIAGLYVDHEVEHATEAHAGIIEIATQGEVLGGASDSKAVTPTKLKQYYYDKTGTNLLLATKQNKLIAGENITIDPETNTISATGGGTGASEFSQLLGSPYDNENLKNALDSKQNTLVAGTNISIDPDTNTISSTSGYAEIVFRKWSDD